MTLAYLAIILLVASFTVSAGLTRLVKNLATRVGFVARPTEDRYHRSTIALGGGISIVATILLFLVAGILIVKFLVEPGRLALDKSATIYAPGFIGKINQLIIVIFCILALFVLGLWDDKKHLGHSVE